MAAHTKIFYALVARERVILCDCGQTGFEPLSQSVLEWSLSQTVNMKTYAVLSRHVYHVMVSDGLRYLCVTDRVFDRQIAFGLLREMEHLLTSNGLREKAYYVGPYGLRYELGSKITPLLEQYSFHDRMNHLQDKVSQVRGAMSENIDKVMHQGENLEDLTDRTALLSNSCSKFRDNNHLGKKLANKHAKIGAMIILIILLIIFMFLIVAAAILTALKLTGHLK